MKKIIYLIFLFCSLLFSPVFSQNNFLDFDGTDDYVYIPNSTAFNFPGGEFTYEAWARSSVPGNWANYDALVSHRTASGDVRALTPIPGGKTMGFYVVGGSIQSPPVADIQDWHHYAGTFDGVTKKLFIDGVEVASGGGGSITTSTDDVRIGSDNCCGGRYLQGQLDEVRIWNVARTPAEIAANYNVELTGGEAGLLAYYKFNQGTCGDTNIPLPTITDSSPNGNDGTMNGFAGTACASNFVCGGVTPCNLDAPPVSGGGAAVPTLGQWGLIILTLLLLSFVTIAIRRRQLAMAGAISDAGVSLHKLPFNKARFIKILLPVAVLVLAIFSLAIAMFGYELTNADVPGTLISAPLLAYLLHMLEGEQEA